MLCKLWSRAVFQFGFARCWVRDCRLNDLSSQTYLRRWSWAWPCMHFCQHTLLWVLSMLHSTCLIERPGSLTFWKKNTFSWLIVCREPLCSFSKCHCQIKCAWQPYSEKPLRYMTNMVAYSVSKKRRRRKPRFNLKSLKRKTWNCCQWMIYTVAYYFCFKWYIGHSYWVRDGCPALIFVKACQNCLQVLS